MKVVFVDPPAGKVRGPHPRLASIAACLREGGATAEVYDLNIEAWWWLAEPDQLAQTRERLEGVVGIADLAREWLSDAEVAQERVDWALRVLRDPLQFYDPREYFAAHDVLEAMLNSARAAASCGRRKHHSELPPEETECVALPPLADLVRLTDPTEPWWFAEWLSMRVLARLEASNADLVGVLITERSQLIPGLALARCARAAGHLVVLAGDGLRELIAHERSCSELLATFADAVIYGDAETASRCLANGAREFKLVHNLIFSEHGRLVATEPHREDADRLPTPDYETFPLSRYLAPQCVLELPTMRPPLTAGETFGHPIEFRRCYDTGSQRSSERVAGDVRRLGQRLSVCHFVLVDEVLDSRRLLDLSSAVGAGSERQHLSARSTFDTDLTVNTLRRAREAGIRRLTFELPSAARHAAEGPRREALRRVTRACSLADIDYCIVASSPHGSDGSRVAEPPRLSEHDRSVVRPRGLGECSLEAEATVTATSPGTHVERMEWLGVERGANAGRFWPVTEGDALLYTAQHERDEDFPFLRELPQVEDSLRFTCRVNPAARVRPGSDGGASLRLSQFECTVSRRELDTFRSERLMTTRAFIMCCSGETTPVDAGMKRQRSYYGGLVARGVLQLRAEDLPPLERGQTLDVFRKKQLLRTLCVREARRLGLSPEPAELAGFVAGFRTRYALREPCVFRRWLATQELSEEKFIHLMWELLLVELLDRRHRSELRGDMIEYIKVFGATRRQGSAGCRD